MMSYKSLTTDARRNPTGSSALYLTVTKLNGRKKLWCEHCKKPWHTKETCWKIHGKPANWKPKSKCDSHTYQATAEETQEPSTNSDAIPFAKEQLEHLYKLFQSPKLSLTPSCSLVQKGNSLATAFLGVIPDSVHSWIIDFGATNHMTGCSKFFSSYSPCAGNKKVKIADGSLSELTTGRMIGSATEKDGLSYFDNGPNSSRQCQST
ncbi:uncharacterized protein LOC131146397 isoform X2 [Malania oleifera]|uniref:uncharacterized protein LOC131146397 isoform X2 n=1 Tax=Malania oleifera TaxID=397392 RepID=UPI0025AEA267|nr:uncharacterized protein LOC131146397 isoform X2 [Malania oleifera]